MYHWFVLIVIVVAILAGLAIGVLNPAEVEIELVFFSWTTTTGMLLVISLLAGLLVGVVTVWFARVLPLQYKLRKSRSETTTQQPGASAAVTTDITANRNTTPTEP